MKQAIRASLGKICSWGVIYILEDEDGNTVGYYGRSGFQIRKKRSKGGKKK